MIEWMLTLERITKQDIELEFVRSCLNDTWEFTKLKTSSWETSAGWLYKKEIIEHFAHVDEKSLKNAHWLKIYVTFIFVYFTRNINLRKKYFINKVT